MLKSFLAASVMSVASLATTLAISSPVQAATLSTYASGFNNPTGIAFDSSGNLFVANNFDTITQVTPSGTRSTFVSGLNTPQGLAFSPSGNLFVADSNNNKVLGFDSSGGVIRTIASNATTTFNNPRNIAFGSSNNSIYITSPNSSKVLIFDNNNPNGRDLNASIENNISAPFGLAIDLLSRTIITLGVIQTLDDIYVTNLGGDPRTVKQVKISGISNQLNDGGLTFSSPLGLAIDPVSKNLYISDFDNNTITALNPQTGANSVLVSSGLNRPNFLTVFGDSLYISDSGSGNILRQELSAVPFEFSPALGIGILGGLFAAKKLSRRFSKK